MPYPGKLDHKNPDYRAVLEWRRENLVRLRSASSDKVAALKLYYKEHPADFIDDWALTSDPRLVERGLPALLPMVLFPKQREWIEWIIDHWKRSRPGLTDKNRDAGVSWVAVSLACTLCVFYEGMAVGFGSRKEEYVDKSDDPKSLFHKARGFMSGLPVEFRAGWTADRHAAHLRLIFPATGSSVTGEAGDNIGRGDRTGIYFVDESAYLERPQLVEASLSQTTNCRMDISTPNGRANPFAVKRFGGKIDVFSFRWQDDPRKDQAWFEKQQHDLDPVTLAQEVLCDYSASAEGVLIPAAWVQAALNAHYRLNIKVSGDKRGALDLADEGRDLNAYCGAHGVLVNHLSEWSGKGDDIYASVEEALELADALGHQEFLYDADGLGAGARGDARKINEARVRAGRHVIVVEPFRGSGEVLLPTKPVSVEDKDTLGRTNEDFFANAKAQAWWTLRTRFLKTWRYVERGIPCAAEDLISLDATMPLVQKLVVELSQPTFSFNNAGKMLIDKTPDGVKSPNLADAVMMRFAPRARSGLKITQAALAAMR